MSDEPHCLSGVMNHTAERVGNEKVQIGVHAAPSRLRKQLSLTTVTVKTETSALNQGASDELNWALKTKERKKKTRKTTSKPHILYAPERSTSHLLIALNTLKEGLMNHITSLTQDAAEN